MFPTPLHVRFNVVALAVLVACVATKSPLLLRLALGDHRGEDPPVPATPPPPPPRSRVPSAADEPRRLRYRDGDAFPGEFPPPTKATQEQYRPPWRATPESIRLLGRQLFQAYLVSHAVLYMAELALTRLAAQFPTMALHHAAAIVLFLLLATRLPRVWPHMRAVHLVPFLVHAVYWSTLTALSAASNDALLALYNATLLTAAGHAYRHAALRAGASVAAAVVTVNYWTYCWELDGAWCVRSLDAAPGEAGREPTRLRAVLWEWGTGLGAARRNRHGGSSAEMAAAAALEWEAGLVNVWFAAVLVSMVLGVSAWRNTRPSPW
ncbi:hypothetical protein H9P43_005970 [Blastocladiella emersonii ATCC 22665]|nr:hypothetical protein H9P43_005970 [Blastocladiella emersonii ATCC 22665]